MVKQISIVRYFCRDFKIKNSVIILDLCRKNMVTNSIMVDYLILVFQISYSVYILHWVCIALHKF